MHIDDNILEKFVMMKESFSEHEKENILIHLDKCALCREAYNTF